MEPILVLRWLNGILVPDPVLAHPSTGVVGKFHMVPPANADSPYGIVRQHSGAADLTAVDYGTTIWVPVVVQVNLYDRVRGDFSLLEPLASRVYELLHAASGATADGIVYGSRRVLVHTGAVPLGNVIERFIEQHFAIEAKSEPS